MSRQLILVRHGQTVHNVAGITQGWNDSDLSELGREQAARVAQRVAALKPTALYSSPLGRALTTAQAIADATGLSIVQHEDLREMSYGGWEGKSFLDVRREDEQTYRQWMSDEEARCPEGESHADVRRRMVRAFAAINDAIGDGIGDASGANGASPVTVVVTHGTAIRIAATALLELPVMASRHFAQDNAAMNVFVWRNDHWVLKVWNQT